MGEFRPELPHCSDCRRRYRSAAYCRPTRSDSPLRKNDQNEVNEIKGIAHRRFGENLPKDPPTSLPLHPVPTRTLALRRLITITDLAQYRKLALTLPSAELSHLRYRLRGAEVQVVEQLFYAGDNEARASGVRDNGVGYTWACVSTNWWEKGGPPTGLVPGSGHVRNKGKGLVLEVGIAVVRCAHLRAVVGCPARPHSSSPFGHQYLRKTTVNHILSPKNGSIKYVHM